MTYYTDRISYVDGSEKRRSKYGSKKTYRKDEPFLCNKCNNVWQFAEQYRFTEYLKGFPKYGCTSKLCDKCKG